MPVSRDEFIAVYNDVSQFPTIEDVARELEISPKTVRNRSAIYRRESPQNVINRSSTDTRDIFETNLRFHEEWTEDDCLESIRAVYLREPSRYLSRNLYRQEVGVTDSTWNRYFGTFQEFRRQAGVQLGRNQHIMEMQIAKHASVDSYRAISEDRKSWGERYIRENSHRFKTALVASDLHDKEVDPFFLRVFLDAAERSNPDLIVLGGDVFDLPEFGRYNVDPREWDVVGRIKFVHDNILAPLRERCPDAQIDIIEGNHEARLLKLVADATPALRVVLSDLHGFTVGKLLGLTDFEVNYVAMGDLAAWTKRDQTSELRNNYRIYWESFLVHHFPHAKNMGIPGVNGHHHKHQVWPMFNPVYGAYEWHQLGSGHRRSANYTEGEKWHNGFIIANVDTETKSTTFDYIQVADFAVCGGKWYHRSSDEIAL